MITHNHANFIARSIDSVLMQKTSFPFELVIGEDASTDSTLQIIHDYASRFPGKILALGHSKNLGMSGNFFNTLARCRGKYIALLEGDDRWPNENKLQIQVDFLEQHAEVIACGGNTFSESDPRKAGYRLVKGLKKFLPPKMEIFSREEMIVSNRFRTLTVVARADAFKFSAEQILSSPVLDWPLFISLTNNNPDKNYVNLPFYFGAYNVHDRGVFSGSSFSSRLKISADAREIISSITHGRYLGWHFPVLRMADPKKYNESFLRLHYHSALPGMKSIFSETNSFTIAENVLARNDSVMQNLGFVFSDLFLKSINFDSFTKNIIILLRMVQSKALSVVERERLLRAVGTAWRDTLFYSRPGIATLQYFLSSPLKKYSGIYWYTVLNVYRRTHIKT